MQEEQTNCPPLQNLVETRQIDEAFDYVARVTRSIVAEFFAAPARDGDDVPAGIEIAVEFFVPPAVADPFEHELDRALMRRAPGYLTARRAGLVGPLRVVMLPPGTFHQWRVAWKIERAQQHGERWSANRERLESLLRQAQEGLREMAGVK
jgi:hypothetical protein